MKKNYTPSFENKLKAYSTLALGVIGMGTINAQIVYHDVNPDRTFTASAIPGDTLSLDINSDGVNDFILEFYSYNSDIGAGLASLGDTSINKVLTSLVSYTNIGYAIPLALNAPIAPNDTNFRVGIAFGVFASVYGGTNYGSCSNGGDAIVGIRFAAGTNIHYGWIRMSGISATGSTGILKDWAYQSTPNTPILAGKTFLSVNELKQENILINTYNSKLHVRFISSVEGTISLTNLMGQEILNTPINNLNMVIDLNDYAKGVYIVNIKSKNEVFTKKIGLN